MSNVLVAAMFLNAYVLEEQSAPAIYFGQLGNAVGISVGVGENQYNTIAQQLDEWGRELSDREKEISERELLLSNARESGNTTSDIFIMAIGLLLLVLIVMNFVLDWRRYETRSKERDLFNK